MCECYNNKDNIFLFPSLVCIALTDLYLCRICHYIIISSFAVLLLNVHPECIGYVRTREASSQWLYTESVIYAWMLRNVMVDIIS